MERKLYIVYWYEGLVSVAYTETIGKSELLFFYDYNTKNSIIADETIQYEYYGSWTWEDSEFYTFHTGKIDYQEKNINRTRNSKLYEFIKY